MNPCSVGLYHSSFTQILTTYFISLFFSPTRFREMLECCLLVTG